MKTVLATQTVTNLGELRDALRWLAGQTENNAFEVLCQQFDVTLVEETLTDGSRVTNLELVPVR